jgi:hypothetical protein
MEDSFSTRLLYHRGSKNKPRNRPKQTFGGWRKTSTISISWSSDGSVLVLVDGNDAMRTKADSMRTHRSRSQEASRLG